MKQPYIDDVLIALREAGIMNVKSASLGNSIGDPIPGIDLDNMMLDAMAVPALNQSGYGLEVTANEFDLKGSQFNLIGYSYGAVVAAVKALSYAKQEGTVDHLVLIGAPINQSLMDELEENKFIKNVIIIDLKEVGDPIKAGMNDLELMLWAPTLAKQMVSDDKIGHFFYSGEPPVGNDRRRKLADFLYEQGLR